MRFITLAATILSTALFGTGCSDDTGTLLVNYRLGLAGTSCAEYGVLDVRVSLDAPERGTLEETERCDNTNGIISINSVPVDVYVVTVEGIDPNGFALYEGQEAGVPVSEDSTTETTLIRLQPIPPSLYVEWTFEGGRLCSQVGVESVDIIVIEELGQVSSETFDCSEGSGMIEDLDSGTYSVYVRAIDIETQEYSYADDILDVELLPGQVTELSYDNGQTHAVLAPCAADCTP